MDQSFEVLLVEGFGEAGFAPVSVGVDPPFSFLAPSV
jgi:hypothetical protein